MCDKPGALNLDAKEILNHKLEIWKEGVETQMHFNELIIKMRTTVISIILAAFGGAAIALRDMELYADFFGCQIHVSSLVLMIGIGFLIAQFIVDYFYYFSLLLGAVNFTAAIEQEYEQKGLFGLTRKIKEAVTLRRAQVSLCCFYGIPVLLGVLGIIVIQCKLTS